MLNEKFLMPRAIPGMAELAAQRRYRPRAEQPGMLGIAQPRSRLDQRIEHGLQIECRAADDLEHVGGGGLLLQQLAQILVRWRSSLSRRVFSMAMTAWAAKFLTSSICLSVNGRTSCR